MRLLSTNTRRAVRAGAALALVLAGACGIPFRHNDRHPYPKKVVTAKEGVNVIVAGESRCLVSTKEFSSIKVGDSFECNWRDSGPAVPPSGF